MDYLKKSNYIKTATSFEQEFKYIQLPSDDTTVLGFLFEWWILLWNFHGDKLVRQASYQDVCLSLIPTPLFLTIFIPFY